MTTCLRCDSLFERRDPEDKSERFCPSCHRSPIKERPIVPVFNAQEKAAINKNIAKLDEKAGWSGKPSRIGLAIDVVPVRAALTYLDIREFESEPEILDQEELIKLAKASEP